MENQTMTNVEVELADALSDFLNSRDESERWRTRCNTELVVALRAFVRAELRQMLGNL